MRKVNFLNSNLHWIALANFSGAFLHTIKTTGCIEWRSIGAIDVVPLNVKWRFPFALFVYSQVSNGSRYRKDSCVTIKINILVKFRKTIVVRTAKKNHRYCDHTQFKQASNFVKSSSISMRIVNKEIQSIRFKYLLCIWFVFFFIYISLHVENLCLRWREYRIEYRNGQRKIQSIQW